MRVQRHPFRNDFYRVGDEPITTFRILQADTSGQSNAVYVTEDYWSYLFEDTRLGQIEALIIDAPHVNVVPDLLRHASQFSALHTLVITEALDVDVAVVLLAFPQLACLMIEEPVTIYASEPVRHLALQALSIRSGLNQHSIGNQHHNTTDVFSMVSAPHVTWLELGPGVGKKEKPTVKALQHCLAQHVFPNLQHLGLYKFSSAKKLLLEQPWHHWSKINSLALYGGLNPELVALANSSLPQQLQSLALYFINYSVDLKRHILGAPFEHLRFLSLSRAYQSEEGGDVAPAYTLLPLMQKYERLTVAFPYSGIIDEDVDGLLASAKATTLAGLDLSYNQLYDPRHREQLTGLPFPVDLDPQIPQVSLDDMDWE